VTEAPSAHCPTSLSLGHVVSNHVVSRTKGGGNMAKFHMLAKRVYTHVDVLRGRLVHACRRAVWQACSRDGAEWYGALVAT